MVKKTTDDFTWDDYTEKHYEPEMFDILQTKLNLDMVITDFTETDGEITFNNRLHENWMELYYQVHKLGVKSVFECGCGCAHHLINIRKIMPGVDINGCDYAQTQIDLGYKYYDLESYDFANKLTVKDLTSSEGIKEMGKHEFVYTQAVTMHLAYDKAKKFLINMRDLSSKYVFLIENINAHDYEDLINEVFYDFERIQDGRYISTGILLKRRTDGSSPKTGVPHFMNSIETNKGWL
tara:strand:- start:563 stop:1273 length:711 start_codon:yes stop_codon:yes gene_type:complete